MKTTKTPLIFIVDDDAGWQQFYEQLLEPEPCQTETFSDGVAMIESTINQTPDLVILDVLLTGPSGFAVLNEMQSYPDLSKIPVILVTNISIQKDLTAYGVTRILDKSTMTPADLLSEIRNNLTSDRLHRSIPKEKNG